MGISLEQREHTETDRSAIEAAQLNALDLIADPNNLARYVNPRSDTLHPLEYAFHLLGDVRGKTILEYGCGDGENTILLANRGANVLSLDLSPDLIDLARRRLRVNGITSGVEFIVGSAHRLPLPDQSVDVVFGIAILHHLDLALASRETRRLLRKGGIAIFQEPVRNSKLMKAIRSAIPYRAPNTSPFERPLTDEELKGFAEGYSEYHVRPFHTLPTSFVYYLLHFLRPSLLRYTTIPSLRFDAAVLQRFPALGYFSPVKVIRLVK